MRRLLLFALLAGLASVSATHALAKTDQADVRGVCNAKGIDIYFWPQGHPAIPAIGFPAFAPPHVEFYKPHDVSNPGALAYMDVTNMQVSANNCSSVADSPMPFVTGATPQTTSQTQKLRCTFAANADVRIGPWTKVTRRVVTRIVKVRGKKKKVRRTITRSVRLGNLGSVGVSGATGAVAEVRLSSVAGTSSTLKWDGRVCAPVDVAG